MLPFLPPVVPIAGKVIMAVWAAMVALGVGAAFGVYAPSGDPLVSQYEEVMAP